MKDEINSFFGTDEIKEFKSEFNAQKKDFNQEDFNRIHGEDPDPEDVDFEELESEQEAEETIHYASSDLATARFVMTYIDDTRAVVASMYSGADKEKYLFYKNLNDNDPVLQAAAQVVRKHQMTLSPEWIISIALVTSSLIVAQQARQDGQKAEKEKADSRKGKAKEPTAPSLKPIG